MHKLKGGFGWQSMDYFQNIAHPGNFMSCEAKVKVINLNFFHWRWGAPAEGSSSGILDP